MNSFLVIQTAFPGDVILATPVIEKLHAQFPNAKIDFLLRKGNESLFENHPFLDEIIVWDKSKSKAGQLWKIINKVRSKKYDVVINLHRFTSSGIVTAFSGAKQTVGFDKNPLSFLFSKKIKHIIGTKEKPVHEVERNISLIAHLCGKDFTPPRLYPMDGLGKTGIRDSGLVMSPINQSTNQPINQSTNPYICIAPASVWFTKQFPDDKWVELINHIEQNMNIFLIGGKLDYKLCDKIKNASKHPKIHNISGLFSFLQSAALMKDAKMNYVNDSAPLHLASAMDAPVTAIFCSTIPEFGFGPLSSNSTIIETKEEISCRPCGLHGYKACPLGHFKCAGSIEIRDIIKVGI